MSAILIGVEAEQVQISGPHEQISRWGVGHIVTLFPSLSVVAILFGSCVQRKLILVHKILKLKFLIESLHNFQGMCWKIFVNS